MNQRSFFHCFPPISIGTKWWKNNSKPTICQKKEEKKNKKIKTKMDGDSSKS